MVAANKEATEPRLTVKFMS